MATLLLRKYFARTSIIAMATPDVGETARGPICICAVKSFPSAGSESFRRELEEFENFRRLRAPTVAGVALGSSDIDLNSNDEVVSTNYGFDLPCEFAVIGCDMRFKPEEFESWISHSISHFCGASLPLRASCTFCHEELSSMNNLETSWRERMIHIGAHFENGCKNMPPDHLVIDYMRENGLITDEQYRIATKNTERGTEGLEDGRLIYIHDINPCQMQAMKVGPVSWGVSSGCGWHSRNVENRSLTKRRAGLILAVFPLLAGFLMGASYLWLNKSMGLAEPSAPMNLIMDFVTQGIPGAIKVYFEEMGLHLEGLLFGLFILATAALTGNGFAWAINKNPTRRAKTIGLIVTALSLVGGMLIGVTAEELFLVCLPQGMGFGIMCSWFLGCKNVQHIIVEKEIDLMADF